MSSYLMLVASVSATRSVYHLTPSPLLAIRLCVIRSSILANYQPCRVFHTSETHLTVAFASLTLLFGSVMQCLLYNYQHLPCLTACCLTPCLSLSLNTVRSFLFLRFKRYLFITHCLIRTPSLNIHLVMFIQYISVIIQEMNIS